MLQNKTYRTKRRNFLNKDNAEVWILPETKEEEHIIISIKLQMKSKQQKPKKKFLTQFKTTNNFLKVLESNFVRKQRILK